MRPLLLGVSSFYHDSAAALMEGGRLRFALQEERVTRIKFDSAFPQNAIAYALRSNGLSIHDVDALAFFEDPKLKMERILSFSSEKEIVRALLDTWDQKVHLEELIRNKTGFRGPIKSYQHHECHAAYAYYSSEFNDAYILVADGVGEWETTSVWRGSGHHMEKLGSVCFPNSLGLFYATLTSFLGFRPNSDEYKVMGLASYGRPLFVDQLRRMVVPDGTGIVCPAEYYDYEHRMYSDRMSELLGMSPRQPGTAVLGAYADVAASGQVVLQEMLAHVITEAVEDTRGKPTPLCIGGGVALNCVAAGWLRDEGYAGTIHIPPGADDSGSAIGAAMLLDVETRRARPEPLNSPFLGPEFDDEHASGYLHLIGAVFKQCTDAELLNAVTDALCAGKTVGWLQGRAEFGPRALGNRSILADPRPAEMRDIINAQIKHRENFRPFAPICLEDKADSWFEPAGASRYMTSVFRSRRPELLAAVTHVDGTARVQTLPREPRTRTVQLLECFEQRTGIPVLLNTSFNLAEEPVVLTPFDAFNTFRESGLDVLALGNCLVYRDQQDPAMLEKGMSPYLALARRLTPLSRSTYFFT